MEEANQQPQVGLWRDKDVLVVARNAELPNLCVKCGQLAHPKRIRKGFNWRPRECYQLAFFGWPGMLLLWAVARERMVLRIPLCEEHLRKHQRIRWLGWALMGGAVPTYFGWLVLSDDLLIAPTIFLGMAFLGWTIFVLFGRPLRGAFVGESYGCFLGAGEGFLQYLPQWSRQSPPS